MPNAVPAEKMGKGHARGAFILAGWVILVIAIAAVISPKLPAPASPAPSPAPTAPQQPSPFAPLPKTGESVATKWDYSDQTFAMDSAPTHFACNTSNGEVLQQWPYHNTTATLCVRRSPRSGLNVYVKLDDDGQLICEYENCGVSVRFDNGPVRRFEAEKPTDNSTNILFIEGAQSFVSALRKSSQAVIELTVYRDGTQQVAFQTDGLKWK